MQRGDVIFSVLLLIGALTLIIGQPMSNAARELNLIPRDRLGRSKLPDGHYVPGPTYLLSALPAARRRDDFADPVSVGVFDFSGDTELPFGEVDGQ